MGKRGSAINVPESWLEQCRRWRDEEGLTVEATGARLARAIKRGRPFGVATIGRYLSGSLVTDELTAAFAKVMGVPFPAQIENERHSEWYELGARLDNANAEAFSTELERLRQLVAIVEELRDLKRDG